MEINSLEKINENVRELLKEKPELAKIENRKLAIWIYWCRFEGISFGITKNIWLRLSNPETLSRAIRNVCATSGELFPKSNEENNRLKKFEECRKFYGKTN